jgi:hypothetical protein
VEALRAQGVKDGRKVVFADEMRIEMIGQVRRKWFLRGYKPRERVERQFVWRYLQLAVQPLTGEIGWRWAERMGGRRGSSGCEAMAGGGDRSCGMGQSRFASGFVCEGGAFTALFA